MGANSKRVFWTIALVVTIAAAIGGGLYFCNQQNINIKDEVTTFAGDSKDKTTKYFSDAKTEAEELRDSAGNMDENTSAEDVIRDQGKDTGGVNEWTGTEN